MAYDHPCQCPEWNAQIRQLFLRFTGSDCIFYLRGKTIYLFRPQVTTWGREKLVDAGRRQNTQ